MLGIPNRPVTAAHPTSMVQAPRRGAGLSPPYATPDTDGYRFLHTLPQTLPRLGTALRYCQLCLQLHH